MTVKIGDKVKIVRNRLGCSVGREYDVLHVNEYGIPTIIDDFGDLDTIHPCFYKLTPRKRSTQFLDRASCHMLEGEYVKAIKWAQIAKELEKLENDCEELEMTTEQVAATLKIININEFERLAEALAEWAEEVGRKEEMTNKERELFDATFDTINDP